MKVPYVVVIGEKELAGEPLIPRIRKDLEVQTVHQPLPPEHFLTTVANETKSRVTHSTI
jgi:threonyl-tRNA synthetase